ncbi:MAG: 16S rRNA (guanine(527)-N(7))-methyltransferase RsmG [Tannerella sp.]|jgi:16S rRNA (guanine527-N7)-methyltransferase|nr:16S rRNA (guanine(527)-N(7))-methyltransferase RsmG [Tannerella sp.]
MDRIRHYYPNLSAEQTEQLAILGTLYAEWNAKINVISRKDIDNLYIHHILHSLAIEKMIHFRDDSIVMDAGTGGGFPGIPLAILFPKVSFRLIDSTGKKVKVAQAIADSTGLKNVTTRHCRLEEEKTKYDFIVSRAVMSLSELAGLVRKNIRSKHQNALPNGLICLKGGELQHEIAPFRQRAVSLDLEKYYSEPFFKKKKVIYVQL